MSLTFSCAEQCIQIPGGPALAFSVAADDSSVCLLAIDGIARVTFKRNGAMLSIVETPSAEPAPPPPVISPGQKFRQSPPKAPGKIVTTSSLAQSEDTAEAG